jgi:AcrR family transcriptional regulator
MSAVREKSGYHHGDLREALLSAAEELLAEEGLQGLTLRACARRAGVSHAAPKHHFRDAAELLSEVSARGFDRLTGLLREAREAAGDDPAERLLGVATTYVAFARRYPALFRLMFRWDALAAEHQMLVEAAGRTFAEMTNAITVQRGDPDVTADTLQARIEERGLQNDVLIGWSHIHGYAQLLLEGQLSGFAAEEGEDAFIERTLRDTCTRLSRLLRSEPPESG